MWAVSAGAALNGRVDFGGRFDRGDAERGWGAEAGGALALAHAGTGFTVEARGRMMLVHQTRAFKDWGAGFALRLQPGQDEGGLSFSVEPTWGEAAGGAQSLWQAQAGFGPQAAAMRGGPTVPADAAAGADVRTAPVASGWSPDRLAFELGWGLVLPSGAQVTPFGRWSREGASGYRLNAGTRWAVLGADPADADTPASGGTAAGLGSPRGLRLTIDLFGEQVAGGIRPTERRLGIQGQIGFK